MTEPFVEPPAEFNCRQLLKVKNVLCNIIFHVVVSINEVWRYFTAKGASPMQAKTKAKYYFSLSTIPAHLPCLSSQP